MLLYRVDNVVLIALSVYEEYEATWRKSLDQLVEYHKYQLKL